MPIERFDSSEQFPVVATIDENLVAVLHSVQ